MEVDGGTEFLNDCLEISTLWRRKNWREVDSGRGQGTLLRQEMCRKQRLLARSFPQFLAGKAFDSDWFPEKSGFWLI